MWRLLKKSRPPTLRSKKSKKSKNRGSGDDSAVENDLQEDFKHAIEKLIFETVLFQRLPYVSALAPHGERARFIAPCRPFMRLQAVK
jgi:hypothetical protein